MSHLFILVFAGPFRRKQCRLNARDNGASPTRASGTRSRQHRRSRYGSHAARKSTLNGNAKASPSPKEQSSHTIAAQQAVAAAQTARYTPTVRAERRFRRRATSHDRTAPPSFRKKTAERTHASPGI